MFRTFARMFLPNPLDWMLRRTAKKGGRRILLGWNRGLGDIALGLYAMVERIREIIPNAEITFLTRENLKQGFSMLEGVNTVAVPWKRGEVVEVKKTLRDLGFDPKQFDLIIEKPSPTDWVQWQRGKVIPLLKWNRENESLYERFGLSDRCLFVGVQVVAETNYGLWRNWPLQRWQELFDRLENMGVKILLFGYGNEPKFSNQNIVDLRGKTTLFELLSIIKNRCHGLVLPDSGISSMTYYLDASFPLRLVSLWADPNHGILKQNVSSPNPQLIHCPLIGERRDLSTVTVDAVIGQLFPAKPLKKCIRIDQIAPEPVQNVAAIILAGGEGTRLGFNGPKGLFCIEGKTLFQWICEKVPPHLPVAVMTSPLNHDETVAYFQKNHSFGLEIHFFQQELSPLLDEKRRPLEMRGPNGNGSVFRSFVQAGLGDLFAKRGIDLVTINYIENPLANPFDARFIAYCRSEKAEAVVQCIEKGESDHSMGVLVEREGKIEIIEYTELDPSQRYLYAYSGALAFDLSFFCRMGTLLLPVHWVQKKKGNVLVWRGEQFIFDALKFASQVGAICTPRKGYYAPLKSAKTLKEVERELKM